MSAISTKERQTWAKWRRKKIDRILEGHSFRSLDLFAGCGGISLGFQKAGFHLSAGLEIDKHASRTHAINFFSSLESQQIEKHATPHDITETEPRDICEEFDWGEHVENTIDIIVGGPPCQAFARVGRSKLREVYEHPEAYLSDPRSNLYVRYLDYVREFQPLAIVMENVPDVLNFGGHNIAEEVCETLESMGYTTKYTLLNSVFYGVPEMRERMILVAYANELDADISFPMPSHFIDLPRGYHGSRQVALKTIKFDDNDAHHYVAPPEPCDTLSAALTAEDALKDLPFIPEDHRCKLKKAPQRFNILDPYPDVKLNKYAKLMRYDWPSFGNSDGGVYDHLIRFLPRDYKIFARMKPGDQYPEAHALANKMFEEELKRLQSKGLSISQESEEFEKLRKMFVPPYDPGKFPNKWRKMEPNMPARTLMAHLGKDSYSHIHYDSNQARTISIREAARLQSFPDGFRFSGSMNPAFKQIGNAVPPLMSFAIAKEVMKTMRKSLDK